MFSVAPYDTQDWYQSIGPILAKISALNINKNNYNLSDPIPIIPYVYYTCVYSAFSISVY